MKNKLISMVLAMACMAGSLSVSAQSGRHPSMNLSGQILDEYGNVLGWISRQGVVQSAIDDRIAVIDKEGNAFDGKGQRIGKMTSKDSFVDAYGSVVFTLSPPKDHHCQLINPDGKIIGMVHMDYRKQASAIYCLFSTLKSY